MNLESCFEEGLVNCSHYYDILPPLDKDLFIKTWKICSNFKAEIS